MVFDILGLVGVLFYISSYGLLQLGVIRGSGYVYASMNIVAATLTLISLMNAFNLWSAISQLFFMTFSGIGMIRIWMASRSIKFTEEEKRLIADRLGAFSILDARRFFDAGQWIDAKSIGWDGLWSSHPRISWRWRHRSDSGQGRQQGHHPSGVHRCPRNQPGNKRQMVDRDPEGTYSRQANLPEATGQRLIWTDRR